MCQARYRTIQLTDPAAAAQLTISEVMLLVGAPPVFHPAVVRTKIQKIMALVKNILDWIVYQTDLN
jgi:hypothetical protein